MKQGKGQNEFLMPAEWERHEATWIGWPHNASDWPGKLGAVHWVYGEIVRKIAPQERVRIMVNSHGQEARACRFLSRAGVERSQVEFFPFPTHRGWTRISDSSYTDARRWSATSRSGS